MKRVYHGFITKKYKGPKGEDLANVRPDGPGHQLVLPLKSGCFFRVTNAMVVAFDERKPIQYLPSVGTRVVFILSDKATTDRVFRWGLEEFYQESLLKTPLYRVVQRFTTYKGVSTENIRWTGRNLFDPELWVLYNPRDESHEGGNGNLKWDLIWQFSYDQGDTWDDWPEDEKYPYAYALAHGIKNE